MKLFFLNILVLVLWASTAVAENWAVPEPLTISDSVFGRPHDLSLTHDGLYLMVADTDNNVVKVLDPGNLRVIGEFGAGLLNSPHDVAIDSQNRVYIADTGNGRIIIYQFDGVPKYTGIQIKEIAQWNEGITWPEGIAIASDVAYVADVEANALLVLENGNVINSITEADGIKFSRPHDVEIDADGRVYLSDPGNDRIVIFNADMTFARSLSATEYGFNEPKYLGLDEDGMLLVTDQLNNRIVMLNHNMRSIGDIDETIIAIGAPEGVMVSGRYIWVSDTALGRIILFRRKRL